MGLLFLQGADRFLVLLAGLTQPLKFKQMIANMKVVSLGQILGQLVRGAVIKFYGFVTAGADQVMVTPGG